MEQFLHSQSNLLKIGQGFCGTVWAEDTDADATTASLVIKRADGGPGRSLPAEQYIHTHILKAVESLKYGLNNTKIQHEQSAKYESDIINGHNIRDDDIKQNANTKNDDKGNPDFRINIPMNIAFLQPTSKHWSKVLPRLPEHFTTCEALISERILPMPLRIRKLLANRYSNGSDVQALQMAQDKSNESCLVRPYLGKRRPEQRGRDRSLRFFSLRNYPLHMNQMEELGLPVVSYAMAMADALAFLHWVARVDAGDVEFVLARPRPEESRGILPAIGGRDFACAEFGEHCLWILDFDCCRELDMSADGVRRAAMCFWRNDPFYPRPGAALPQDQHLWDIFETRFLEKSAQHLEKEREEIKKLPEMLLQLIRDNRSTWTKGAIPQ